MPSATTSASDPERVEVVTSVQRRRRWSLSEKLRAVEDASAPGMTISYIARKLAVVLHRLWLDHTTFQPELAA